MTAKKTRKSSNTTKVSQATSKTKIKASSIKPKTNSTRSYDKYHIRHAKNKNLEINKKGGHYVVVIEGNKKEAMVNVITSLEKNGKVLPKKIEKIRNGFLVEIDYKKTGLHHRSGVDMESKIIGKKYLEDPHPSLKLVRKDKRKIFNHVFNNKQKEKIVRKNKEIQKKIKNKN